MKFYSKVLLIENDEFTRFMMSEMLSTMGVEFDTSTDGTEGCEILDSNPEQYGLVLMDLHMPRMSGIEATRVIRSKKTAPPKNIPIIAVTADMNYHDSSRVKALGMNGYESKPVSPQKIESLVHKYCSAA